MFFRVPAGCSSKECVCTQYAVRTVAGSTTTEPYFPVFSLGPGGSCPWNSLDQAIAAVGHSWRWPYCFQSGTGRPMPTRPMKASSGFGSPSNKPSPFSMSGSQVKPAVTGAPSLASLRLPESRSSNSSWQDVHSLPISGSFMTRTASLSPISSATRSASPSSSWPSCAVLSGKTISMSPSPTNGPCPSKTPIRDPYIQSFCPKPSRSYQNQYVAWGSRFNSDGFVNTAAYKAIQDYCDHIVRTHRPPLMDHAGAK